MKLFVTVVFSVLFAGSFGAPVDTIRELIEDIREYMPCGLPEYGLPVLAPFILDTFKLEDEGIFAKLDDLRVEGLNSFEIDHLTLNILTFKMTFGFTFKEISLKTLYDMNIALGGVDIEGITGLVNIFGQGDIDFALKGLSLAGNLALQFHEGGSSSLKEFKLAVHVEKAESRITGLMGNEIVNDFINDLLVSVINTFTEEMQPFISDTVESLVIPMADKLLVNFTVSDIMGWITGGGGGTPGPTKAPCIVDEDKKDISFLFGLN